jgi:hypothetical protein
MPHERQRFVDVGFDDFIAKPFRYERICDCLAQLLGVEFDSAESVRDEETELLPVDLESIVVPENLFLPLQEAAELYSVTELESCIDDVAKLSSAGRQLAEHLRRLLKNYDMEGILNVLAEIKHE